MYRLKHNIVFGIFFLVMSIIIFMPVVRSFYGAKMHLSVRKTGTSVVHTPGVNQYVRMISWSLIRNRQMISPVRTQISLSIPFFLISLLAFLLGLTRNSDHFVYHLHFQVKPHLTGSTYLRFCLLLI